MRYTTLRRTALGLIAILAVVLMVDAGGSAGSRVANSRMEPGSES